MYQWQKHQLLMVLVTEFVVVAFEPISPWYPLLVWVGNTFQVRFFWYSQVPCSIKKNLGLQFQAQTQLVSSGIDVLPIDQSRQGEFHTCTDRHRKRMQHETLGVTARIRSENNAYICVRNAQEIVKFFYTWLDSGSKSLIEHLIKTVH